MLPQNVIDESLIIAAVRFIYLPVEPVENVIV
jgi:hypothetical protein